MRYVFVFLLVLFANCSKPPPKTAATTPVLGMYLFEFQTLCGYDPDDAKTVKNESGETLTLVNKLPNINGNPRIAGCDGTFTFVNNKLTQIVR